MVMPYYIKSLIQENKTYRESRRRDKWFFWQAVYNFVDECAQSFYNIDKERVMEELLDQDWTSYEYPDDFISNIYVDEVPELAGCIAMHNIVKEAQRRKEEEERKVMERYDDDEYDDDEECEGYREAYRKALDNLEEFRRDVNSAETVRELLDITSGFIYGYNYDPANGYAYLVFCRHDEESPVELCTAWNGMSDYGDNETDLGVVVYDDELDDINSDKLCDIQEAVENALDYYADCAHEYWIEDSYDYC